MGEATQLDIVMLGPTLTPQKGDGGEPVPFSVLTFHYRLAGAQVGRGVDLRVPQDLAVALSQDDDYRLVITPAQDFYVYAYQLTGSDRLLQLFPNDAYSAAANPLPAGVRTILPEDPKWFYVAGDAGTERLYIVASQEPQPHLDALYAEYQRAGDAADQHSRLQDVLEALTRTDSPMVFLQTFAFDHR
jgi:hypothetical protein